jgi:hypothetical protein
MTLLPSIFEYTNGDCPKSKCQTHGDIGGINHLKCGAIASQAWLGCLDGGMFSFGSKFHLGGRHFSNDGCHDLKQTWFQGFVTLQSKA